MLDMNEYMPASAAAQFIGVTTGRIRQIIAEKKIRAKKFATRDWWVLRADAVEMKRNPSKVGRPRSGKK